MLSSSCSPRSDPVRVTAQALYATPSRALIETGVRADRRTVLLGWGAALLQPQLATIQRFAQPTLPFAAPRLPLAYLDPSICVSAAYPKDVYLDKMRSSEQLARRQLGDLLDLEAYSQLSNSMILEAFNDMRQAAFYLPCALAHESKDLANKAQDDYIEFLKQCRRLDTTSRAAANARADHEDVEDALAMVWKYADEMLRVAGA